MSTLDSNIDDVGRWLDDIVDSIDFTMPGKDASLGKDLAGVVAKRIVDRSVPDAKAPDGGTWKANEAKYAASKLKRLSADQPGILSGQMLSLESMQGDVTITPDTVTIKYGTGTPATRSRTGAPLRPSEKVATDREKAGYFADGGREFFGFGEGDDEAVIEEARDALAKHPGRA